MSRPLQKLNKNCSIDRVTKQSVAAWLSPPWFDLWTKKFKDVEATNQSRADCSGVSSRLWSPFRISHTVQRTRKKKNSPNVNQKKNCNQKHWTKKSPKKKWAVPQTHWRIPAFFVFHLAPLSHNFVHSCKCTRQIITKNYHYSWHLQLVYAFLYRLVFRVFTMPVSKPRRPDFLTRQIAKIWWTGKCTQRRDLDMEQ